MSFNAFPIAGSYNFAQYNPDSTQGHYESYFLRANHATRPLAFWIRYTVFAPQNKPQSAMGELWAMWFDSETGQHIAVKQEVPVGQFHFSRNSFNVEIGDAYLRAGQLFGQAQFKQDCIAWDLNYHGNADAAYLFTQKMYQTKLPKAKILIGQPLAHYDGSITVNGQTHPISDWVGTESHNWGSKHTDEYAWGQVAGFDNAPTSFLELATAQLKIGPFWTPRMTPLILRHEGHEYAVSSIMQSIKARGKREGFVWRFSAQPDAHTRIEGEIRGDPKNFVGLTYHNPPGPPYRDKYCLNSKIAECSVTLTRAQRAPIKLYTASRAAFEILTDDAGNEVAIRV